jgi:hypothetical protein
MVHCLKPGGKLVVQAPAGSLPIGEVEEFFGHVALIHYGSRLSHRYSDFFHWRTSDMSITGAVWILLGILTALPLSFLEGAWPHGRSEILIGRDYSPDSSREKE